MVSYSPNTLDEYGRLCCHYLLDVRRKTAFVAILLTIFHYRKWPLRMKVKGDICFEIQSQRKTWLHSVLSRLYLSHSTSLYLSFGNQIGTS